MRCCSVALASQLFDRVGKVDDACGGVEPQIVFLVAALPAVVGPEIALGLPAYRRLKQLEVAVGELPLGGLLGMVSDRHEVSLVVSASYASHDKEFEGTVTAISGATGAKYSLVPTDNSAGYLSR